MLADLSWDDALQCCINPLARRGLGGVENAENTFLGEEVLHTDRIIIFINEDSLHPFLMTLLRAPAVLTIGEGEMCRFEKKNTFEK